MGNRSERHTVNVMFNILNFLKYLANGRIDRRLRDVPKHLGHGHYSSHPTVVAGTGI